MKIKAIIFDFDGTIVDTNFYHLKSFEKTFKKFNLKISIKEVKNRLGMPAEKILEELINDKKLIKKIIKEKEKEFEKTVKLKEVKGIRKFLKFLKNKKITTIILSSSRKKLILKTLKKLKLIKYFDFIFAKEDLKYHKPNPKSILEVLRKIKGKRENVVFIGDSYIDAITAKKAKINFIAIKTKYFSAKKLKMLGAKFVGNYNEIKNFLEV